MTQKDVIQRIMIELSKLEIITEENHTTVQMYLQQAYGAGFDMARMQSTYHKKVGQYSLDHKLIKVWESGQAASRKTGIQASDISKCAQGKLRRAGGFHWRFVDRLTAASIETVGSTQLKSVLPKQGTHVSKISSV